MNRAGETPDLGLYLHWPWCARICPYCDFNVLRDRGDSAAKAELVAAMVSDIAAHAERLGPRRLVSIFFGGGTPSRMDPADVATLIGAARRAWRGEGEVEVSLEANPDDAEPARWADLARAGVNRLSLGAQSFVDTNLRALGRNHDATQALEAARLAGRIFPRLSIDMIWGLPGQNPEAWSADLEIGIGLGAEHISAYELTFEAGTAFDRARRRGVLAAPDEGRRADLYDLTNARLEAAGYEAYEVSNHARGPAARVRHNLLYWRGHDYVGVGPGAHGRLTLGCARWAAAAPRGLQAYLGRVAKEGFGPSLERLTPRDRAIERLLMGLRISEGVEVEALEPLAIPPSRYEELEGLVRQDGRRVVATWRGRRVLDALIARLVD